MFRCLTKTPLLICASLIDVDRISNTITLQLKTSTITTDQFRAVLSAPCFIVSRRCCFDGASHSQQAAKHKLYAAHPKCQHRAGDFSPRHLTEALTTTKLKSKEVGGVGGGGINKSPECSFEKVHPRNLSAEAQCEQCARLAGCQQLADTIGAHSQRVKASLHSGLGRPLKKHFHYRGEQEGRLWGGGMIAEAGMYIESIEVCTVQRDKHTVVGLCDRQPAHD